MLNLKLKLMGNPPFKMKYSGKGRGVPALMKALVGKQEANLPEKLKQAILDAPETSKKKTSKEDSPVRSTDKKMTANERARAAYKKYAGKGDKARAEARSAKSKPKTQNEQSRENFEKYGTKSDEARLDKKSSIRSYGSKEKAPMMKTGGKKMSREEYEKNKETMDYRKGKGRINRKTGKIMETNVDSIKVTGGARLTKRDEKGNRTWVVKEKTAMGKKSLASGTKTAKSKPSTKADLSKLKKKDAKSKSPAIMMKGVKGLKNQRGKR